MATRTKALQEFEKPHRRYFEEIRNDVSKCNDCKQAVSSSDGVYCGVWREKINDALCRSCSHFDLEPSEYRQFRRM